MEFSSYDHPSPPSRRASPVSYYKPSSQSQQARIGDYSSADNEDDDDKSSISSAAPPVNRVSQSSTTRAEVKCLYSHSYSSGRRHVIWSEFEDPREEEARSRAATACFAVVHRRKKSGDADETTWKTDSIIVNGPRLQAVLKEVFKNYPRWMKSEEPFVFRPPFQQFLDRWEKLKTALNQDESMRSDGNSLIHELTPFIERHQKNLDAITDSGVVSFEHLWHIFPPGETGRHGSTNTTIYHYQDVLSVAELPVVPLKMKGDRQKVQDIQEMLLLRGRKFEAMRSFHGMHFIGSKSVCSAAKITKRPQPGSGRVVIDAYAFYHCQRVKAPSLMRDEADEVAFSKSELHVDVLHATEWSDVPFQKLVLPPDEKELILAMADRDRREKTGFDDIVQRKGRGIIFLLCGQPGVGKTLTVEAVADKYQVLLIDLILRYPNLDDSVRRTIWKNFLDRVGEGAHSINDTNLEELMRVDLNGREIKNLIKTASVLAMGKGSLTMDNLRTVISIRQRL
ncbi:hypothetical protein N7478_012183 [Penicillium angulare]|uniref:uncharacterized protein n=1 Tax=Penicillium angulare TaxID=116970 RepID=UPI0025423096|nr:uncharacterized protein N7478_012183 [Penicillium angulare]KAJ5260578.1 hypothetical protein N7478_012183 [Penicillium angulare]